MPPRAALVAFLVVQAALMLRMALVAPTGGAIARKPDDWRYFDSRALAEALHAPAMRALGGPVRLVSGPPAEAGALALRLPERPLVLIRASRVSAPAPADLASRCGALELKRAPARPEGFEPVAAEFRNLYWRVRRPDGNGCGASDPHAS